MDFDDSPAPPQRLRKRGSTPKSPLSAGYNVGLAISPTPLKPVPQNAFEVMTKAAKANDTQHKRRLEKSEFIEHEAQESDEDEMFGFGSGGKNDEDEDDGEDLDKTLETLVDDQEMNEKVIAAGLVWEKYK